jgi:bifunctional lysine-specific demethylase and histidyl-hydroxylase NO66
VSQGTLERVGADRPPLERCAGDPRSFLENDWGTRAAVRLEAEPGTGFEDLLSLDDVDRFLTTTALRTPFFRLVKAGERIPETAYSRSGRAGSRAVQGIADPARVATLFEDGATIVLQGLHRWSEPVTRFCRGLELAIGHPCQVNAYITPPGAQGLDLHVDAHDVFVLQAFGRKRWELHAAPREERRDPLDVEVGPGDTIYLPEGTPHAARAQDQLSGHLTVGIHVARWHDVLMHVVTGEAFALDDRVPAAWLDDPEGFGEQLRERLAALADALGRVDVRREAGERRERFLSTRAQLARGTIVERSAPVTVGDSTVVARRPDSVCEVSTTPDRLVVLLGDRRLEMPAWVEPAIRQIARLGDEAELTVRDLALHLPDPASRTVLIRRLVREGLLTIRDGR